MVYAGKELIYKFIHLLIVRFPTIFGDLTITDVAKAFNRFISASTTVVTVTNQTVKLVHESNFSRAAEEEQQDLAYFTEAEVPVFLDENHDHTIAEAVAHALHKISIIILGILVLFVSSLMFCGDVNRIQC